MILALSGMFYCMWIISVGCVCNGAASYGAGFVEESGKEGELDYPKGTWREKAQNNKYGDSNLFDTHVEGNEGGARETSKEERMMKKYTKQWNERSGEIGKGEKWSFCDEWKMWGKERMFEGSLIEGCLVLVNSSMKLNSLTSMERGGESVLRASDGSSVEVSVCVIGVRREIPPFDLCESCGLFSNISLRSSSTSSSTSTEQVFPPLFSSKAVEGEISEECHISVCSSHFSSFCVSSAPFLSLPSIPLVSLSQLTFFNVSTAPDACPSPTTAFSQTTCLMNSCTFSSVCDVYDGGIVPSLSNPFASLTASNTSFVGCCRTRNVECIGTTEVPLKPDRQNTTANGANSFTWCEWSESKATGKGETYSDGTSNGGAIFMYGQSSATVSIKHCSFNDCYAHYDGGGVMCAKIKSVEIENNTFNSCTAQNQCGGGMYAYSISTCVRISGCDFENSKANSQGGALCLGSFQVSGTGCIGDDSEGGKIACMFSCSFTLCSVTNYYGGGVRCYNVPNQFKMRNIKFISCTAVASGGGLYLEPFKAIAPDEKFYCYFLFFHNCNCKITSNPYGHDVEYVDYYNVHLDSGNPFFECCTTNTDNKRMCYAYNYTNAGAWTFQHTEKKEWLKDKTIYVSVNGSDGYELCGSNESNSCLTVKKAFEMCEVQISLTITLMEGEHQSETTTIEIGSKKISVIGTGKDESSIGTGALSSIGQLFSVSTGHLGMSHLKVDCHSNANPSPSVVVVSDGSGSLSLEDVVVTTSKTGDYVMSSSVFVALLSQLLMTDVEIKDLNVSKPLFSEQDLSSSSLSLSALLMTYQESGDSVLANVKVTNVKLTEGDGVVMAKSVKAEETFVVKNVTIEDCECKAGSGGGIKVDLLSPTSKLRAETLTKFSKCKCSGYGGGIMLRLEDGSHDFSIVSVDFTGCTASSGGNYLFVNGINTASWGITTSTLKNIQSISTLKELVGIDRSDSSMGQFPLNVFLDTFPNAAHVGKAKKGLGGYNSWFCGLDYYPCATITHAAVAQYTDSNKNIELDPGFELAEEVAMADTNEWKIFCATIETKVNVINPETKSSDWLIKTQNTCSCTIENITFSIPTVLTDVTSLILASSALLKLTDCSVGYSSGVDTTYPIEYSFVKATEGNLRLVRFMIKESLTIDGHSFVEFEADMNVVYFEGCSISSVEKKNGDGGLINGVIGKAHASAQDTSGIVVIDSCIIKNCKCHGKENDIGRGGGIFVRMDGKGRVVVNGSNKIGGCEAKNYEGGTKGRGGGMMMEILNSLCTLNISSENAFSSQVLSPNDALYGKDIFIRCGSKIWLNEMVNENSFSFFDKTTTPSDVLKFCGSEDLKDGEVIPLFVYLQSIGSTLTVGRSRDMVLDHSYCGFEKFGCLTIDYCMNTRVDDGLQTVEVVSKSSITNVIKVISRSVNLKGKEESVGEKMKVEVKDGGDTSPNYLIECTKSFEMTNLEFVMNKEINGKRSAFIYSTSTVTITSCSVSFTSDALANEKIAYNILNIAGGELIVDGLMMEIAATLTMNGKSPISMTSGVKLDIKNSRVSGVTVEGGSGEGGGCIGAAINEDGSTIVDNCSFSSVCTGVGGMKGGGMMISAEDGGSLEIKSVTFTGCQVPAEDKLQKGRGVGGGMFVRLADTMGSFKMEGVTFSGCNAWKGKKVFISGNELDEVMSNEQLKWGLSASDEKSLYELCGWERKTTGENGYAIPLVVYLWRNWSKDGFVSNEKGGDFSGCGYSEAPCSSINHLISLRYLTLGKGESQISIGDSGLLSHSISFLSSLPTLPDSEAPAVVIKGTKKGTGVTISDEDENDLDEGSMISSNVSLSFVNVSFTKPSIIARHEVFIDSSGTNTLLSVSDCSFGPGRGVAESFGYCLMRVNGGSVLIERSSLSLISELKGLIAFSPSAGEVTLQNVNISFVDVTERSLISMMEKDNQMNGEKKDFSNGNKPVLRVVGCSFANITKEGIGASVVDVGSFEDGVECVMDECSMSSCKSGLSDEGGGMRVVLKSEESMLKVNGSSFSICKCSSETGCGGGLFIDGSDPHANYGNESQIPPLNFKIVNILFVMNEAHVGKDVFVRCHSIEHQINETLFALNYNQESLNSNNSICGRDGWSEGDVDLIPLITFYYSAQVFVSGRGSDGRGCGAQSSPCSSINCGVEHIQEGVMNAILIDGEGFVTKECVIGDLVVKSFKKTQAIVRLNSKIEKSTEKDCMMVFVNECSVERCSFQFEDGFESTHNYIIKVKNGSLEMRICEFFSSSTAVKLMLNSSIVSVECREVKIFETTFRDIHSTRSVLSFCEESDVIIDEARISNIECEKDVVSVGGKAKVEMKGMGVGNVTLLLKGCVIWMDNAEQEMSVLNSSSGKCVNSEEKGSMMQIRNSKNVRIENCVFDGEKEDEIVNEESNRKEGLCKWNGSLIDIENSNVEMRETAIRNSKAGGLWVSGGSMKIENSKFENNNPEIEGYPSARRNAICTGDSELNVVSVKGGDGLKDNSSLWILDEGCQLGGIASERASFFIPILEEVKNSTQLNGNLDLIISGKLLLPCDLSVKMSMKNGDEEEIVRKEIDEEGFVSENEIHSVISSSELEKMREETEVSVCIVFGKGDLHSSTEPFIVKNMSESQSSGNERIAEGGKGGKSSWILIVCIAVVAVLLFALIIFFVRWRKAKNENKELREIVNDTVRKDPKLIEMVTMEPSPEEQWRRAEREAEKKNEERIKKRVCEKNLGHSESSEHLLSESDSTEYILGKDSDKIPDWALEKEEEEEIRKRTPSPSISSTSTNSTTDSDSTFVRGEDLCPTTSSMSNLVDAIACSSPHEKLIVDLRDSLFMLLHGRNKTKEMAIGTLQEREQTAAQILFWVANLALHSFDEMENGLSSLSTLSPHIVLFSEHMVICIVLHSDLLLSDDSDSDLSSISSSTIVTSASGDDDDDNSLPSSAFEDENDFKNECLRWKAPELLINKKMGATKESVVFSIGMLLWECLTLQIPFGEYPAEVAGGKIFNGERPDMTALVEESGFGKLVESCWQSQRSIRISLDDLKRELFLHFPAGTMILTMSDAIEDEDGTEEEKSKTDDGTQVVSGSQEKFSVNSPKRVKKSRKRFDERKTRNVVEKEMVKGIIIV
ncbi:uncharacterized protein MONOS_7424 [Monocercomonoides exilis]|uniref:uncharacterized protein n=1 Tax=Monocercomonoides exilis TaxID=2049356 RepID=UPI003559A4E6|nr:hypothetical protein MONOS_7424 [Monocercomonoides exilis]|eukprot:MONOS_7424.1-p1 / transcript=MONOS_7424.1 / gene=MONOS_7424 / organism=Monocercomonoides_exilis_PA203 / gene_product=unspecified product / transcript_product=unspecified product / location=Mono_scaffold00253:21220-30573(-) / protein_length=3117 / sequence_SO=supercontig / SO=protein_coding / is_pseudo=false